MSSKSSLVGATTPENRTANPGSFHVFWLRVQRSHPLFVGTVWVSFSDFSIRDSNFCIAPSSKFYQHVGEKKKQDFILRERLKGELRKGPQLLGPKRVLPKTRFVTKRCSFFMECMNETVPENVNIVCERATYTSEKRLSQNGKVSFGI